MQLMKLAIKILCPSFSETLAMSYTYIANSVEIQKEYKTSHVQLRQVGNKNVKNEQIHKNSAILQSSFENMKNAA